MFEFRSHSPEETAELASRLAANLQPGDVLALYGDLGSGKTCFVQGCARGLGVKDRYIVSPSFVLVREYRGQLPLYHIDLYRLNSGLEIGLLGIEEYIDSDGVTAIEWAEKLEGFLPDRTIKVEFKFLDETSRKINIYNFSKEKTML
ncbi:MAG: tRNA (adenosine(37)-N6)-threonylcarbamoyltransferase complex ATPase subunit type 1 TsaE [Candidatus Euphemobacter frigidus]|nr:tRNA (adenosine(37)-N6)-threonylcarbamoyltransferase complex ATPase subunit type 1 TsaE [Candidatus Euphemobacter frigidus]MDP8275773.1 tRNA (adenosine(37)-N6)-threonylcarbamoyltransferase complex ATPase subunit type 1 TsaE [Candidatus Euphemobacter frigidus]